MPKAKAVTRKSRPTLAPRSDRGRPRSKRSFNSLWLVGGAVGAVAIASTIFWLNRPDVARQDSSSPYVGGDLHSFVAAPVEPGLLFVGGHQAVSVSKDGGLTWTAVESLHGADAMGWAVLDAGIWVGGHPGLEVSTDGGRSFEPRNDGLPATDIHALGGTGSMLFAASPAAGFLASSDAGTTWEVRNPTVGQSFMGALLVDPSNPDHIVAPDSRAGAVQSLDGGRNWTVLGGVPGAMWVSWDPADLDRIVVSGLGAAAMSGDGGATWEPLDVPPGSSIVQIDPTDRETWYAAALTEDGAVAVSVSSDGGTTWDPL